VARAEGFSGDGAAAIPVIERARVFAGERARERGGEMWLEKDAIYFVKGVGLVAHLWQSRGDAFVRATDGRQFFVNGRRMVRAKPAQQKAYFLAEAGVCEAKGAGT